MTADKELSINFFGYPHGLKHHLKFARQSSNVALKEFVLSSLIALPLLKPLLTPWGWHEVKFICLIILQSQFPKVLKPKCSTYAPYCDSHPCGQVSLDKNEFKRGYQTTVFVADMAHDFQVFSQLIDYSPILFVWSKSYTPNNLSGKYFKLVETFLILVVSQNVFRTEIDNPFFYKVLQLAPEGDCFAKKFCTGGWWNSP